MTQLPEPIANALAPFAPPSSAVHDQVHQLRQYRAALDAFDWSFEMSDDHQTWARGTNALSRLRRMQAQMDPDGAIWAAHPGAQCFGAPQPIVRSAA